VKFTSATHHSSSNPTSLKQNAKATSLRQWQHRVLGIVVSIASINFLIVGPLIERMNTVEEQISSMDGTIQKVIEHPGAIDEVNELLSGLARQHDGIAAARASVAQLTQLQKELRIVSRDLPMADAAVQRLAQLPEDVMQAEVQARSAVAPMMVSDIDPRTPDRLVIDDDNGPSPLLEAFPAMASFSASHHQPESKHDKPASEPQLETIGEAHGHATDFVAETVTINGWSMQFAPVVRAQ